MYTNRFVCIIICNVIFLISVINKNILKQKDIYKPIKIEIQNYTQKKMRFQFPKLKEMHWE